jgi:transposase
MLFFEMNNSEQIFAIALGLKEPWFIEKILFDQEKSQFDIYLKFTKGSEFQMEDGNLYTAHDTVERKWQHLNFFQHTCYLHARVPKVKQSDGKIKTQTVPWARKGSGFTLLF